jgi:YD repeat-containing protein
MRTVDGRENATLLSYDALSRLSSIAQGASVVGMFYDALGRPISMSLPLSMTVDYGYDGQGRLTSMIYKRLGVQFGDLGYGYDNQGRRVRMTGSLARVGLPQTVSGANYNAANQLTSWNGVALTYDTNGNLTNDGTNTYTWNARNQLSSITGGVSASFAYDAKNRRTNRTVNSMSVGYLHDGDNPVQEIASGATNIWAGKTDEFFQRANQTMLRDALGSVIGLADASGAVVTQLSRPKRKVHKSAS